MALFSKKQPTDKPEDIRHAEESKKVTKKVADKKPVTKTATKAVSAKKSKTSDKAVETKVEGKSDYSYRITEKATRLADKNVYVLNIPKTSNKTELKKVLETKYKVKVVSINIVNSPKKAKMYRGKLGQKGGGKKAYITLKAGDSIVL